MKRHLLFVLTATALSVATASVPQRWVVETSRLQPVSFDVARGESLALEATFNSYGNPLSMAGKPCQIFWQTNGMGAAWWKASATATSNRIAATFTPQMDPGAPVVVGFLGSTGDNYRAAFTLRFRHAPGATPNELPLPTPTIDCQKVTFLHPESAPFSGGGGSVSTNAVSGIITNHVESGYLCTVETAKALTNGLATSSSVATAKAQAIATASADATAKANAAKAASLHPGINYISDTEKISFDFGSGGSFDMGTIRTGFGWGHFLMGGIGSKWYYLREDGRAYPTPEANEIATIGDLPTPATPAFTNAFASKATETAVAGKQDRLPYPTNAIPASSVSGLPTPDYTTNNVALVTTITNLAPTRARGLVLHDSTLNCNWYQVVTNGVFYWLIED